MDPQKKRRKENWSEAEIEVLKSEVEARQSVLFGSFKNITASMKREAWKQVTQMINVVNGSIVREESEVSKKWQSIKSGLKDALAEKITKSTARKTGGGEPGEELTPEEDRILGIIKKAAVVGVPGGIDTGDSLCVISENNSGVGSGSVKFSNSSEIFLNGSESEEDISCVTTVSAGSSGTSTPSSSRFTPTNGTRFSHKKLNTPSESAKRLNLEYQDELLEVQQEVRRTLVDNQGELVAQRECFKNGIEYFVATLQNLVEISARRLETENALLQTLQSQYRDQFLIYNPTGDESHGEEEG